MWRQPHGPSAGAPRLRIEKPFRSEHVWLGAGPGSWGAAAPVPLALLPPPRACSQNADCVLHTGAQKQQMEAAWLSQSTSKVSEHGLHHGH